MACFQTINRSIDLRANERGRFAIQGQPGLDPHDLGQLGVRSGIALLRRYWECKTLGLSSERFQFADFAAESGKQPLSIARVQARLIVLLPSSMPFALMFLSLRAIRNKRNGVKNGE